MTDGTAWVAQNGRRRPYLRLFGVSCGQPPLMSDSPTPGRDLVHPEERGSPRFVSVSAQRPLKALGVIGADESQAISLQPPVRTPIRT